MWPFTERKSWLNAHAAILPEVQRLQKVVEECNTRAANRPFDPVAVAEFERQAFGALREAEGLRKAADIIQAAISE